MKRMTFLLMLTAVTLLIAGCSPGRNLTKSEKMDRTDAMAVETLQRLYTEKVTAEAEIKNAPGYGVFSNANINIIFASAGGGYGVVVDNKTDKKTYMKMIMGGLGLGLGAKDFRQVVIFENKDVMNRFVFSGWEFGGHVDAAAKAGEKGAEASGEGFIGGVKVYAMTEAGLALQATVTGTKYYKDDELN